MSGEAVLDFTSALYLGLAHDSGSLRWKQLTTGAPAAVRPPPGAGAVEAAFAALVGCARAVALTSTLHAFWDLFGPLSVGRAIVYDEGVYPIARWGIERAVGRGARAVAFAHHDPDALEAALRRIGGGLPPWVLSDAICLGCSRVAPLADYARLTASRGGLLILDDTQGVGVLGRDPSPDAPLGRGGGGSLRCCGLAAAPVVVVASLAKAFGAPLALLAGAAPWMDAFHAHAETLVHCSPPSAAHLAAAARALAVNAAAGDRLRARLIAGVCTFRRALRARGVVARGGVFPVQRVPVASAVRGLRLRNELAARGLQAVVQRARCTDQVALAFAITTQHDDDQLLQAATLVAGVLDQQDQAAQDHNAIDLSPLEA